MSESMALTQPDTKHPDEFVRLTLNQRIQHWLLILSFVTLVGTGMPLRYWRTGAAETAIMLMGGIGMRSVLHRLAAIILILLCIYHLFYVLFSRRVVHVHLVAGNAEERLIGDMDAEAGDEDASQ